MSSCERFVFNVDVSVHKSQNTAGTLKDNRPADAHLFTLILSRLHTADGLFVNEFRADLVLIAVMPGGKDFLTEEETPGSMLFLPSSSFYFPLTLRDGVQQVLPTAAQSPHLQEGSTFKAQTIHGDTKIDYKGSPK